MKKFSRKQKLIVGGAVCLLLIFSAVFCLLISAAQYKTFRTMQDIIAAHEKVDLTGLRDLQASGGSALYFPDLQRKLDHVEKNITVVDGREIDEGYVKGRPIYYFGYEKSKPKLRHRVRRLVLTGSLKERPDLIMSEEQMAQQYGYKYQKLAIYSLSDTPDEAVDEFVAFIDQLPADMWLHFHCQHGRGRTSMMLAMLDIMRNAPQVSLEDIMRRQHLLGSVDLSDVRVWKKSTYTVEQLSARRDFIGKFYEFICQRKAGGIQRWSEWRRRPLPAAVTECSH